MGTGMKIPERTRQEIPECQREGKKTPKIPQIPRKKGEKGRKCNPESLHCRIWSLQGSDIPVLEKRNFFFSINLTLKKFKGAPRFWIWGLWELGKGKILPGKRREWELWGHIQDFGVFQSGSSPSRPCPGAKGNFEPAAPPSVRSPREGFLCSGRNLGWSRENSQRISQNFTEFLKNFTEFMQNSRRISHN